MLVQHNILHLQINSAQLMKFKIEMVLVLSYTNVCGATFQRLSTGPPTMLVDNAARSHEKLRRKQLFEAEELARQHPRRKQVHQMCTFVSFSRSKPRHNVCGHFSLFIISQRGLSRNPRVRHWPWKISKPLDMLTLHLPHKYNIFITSSIHLQDKRLVIVWQPHSK